MEKLNPIQTGPHRRDRRPRDLAPHKDFICWRQLSCGKKVNFLLDKEPMTVIHILTILEFTHQRVREVRMGSAQVKQFPQPDDPQNDGSNSRIASLRSERSPNWDVADRSDQQERIRNAIPDSDQPNNIRRRQSHTLHSTANIAVPEPDPLLTAEDVAQRLRGTRSPIPPCHSHGGRNS